MLGIVHKCGLPDVVGAPAPKLQPHQMQPIEEPNLPF